MMTRKTLFTNLAVLFALTVNPAMGDEVIVSPNGSLAVEVHINSTDGTVSYDVTCKGTKVIDTSPLGLTTDKGDFTSGLKWVDTRKKVIDETYTLPVGKRSTYLNKAKEATLTFSKKGEKIQIIFRAYDDGIAFRYAVPGEGEIHILSEATGFKLVEKPVYWGQAHPTSGGNENGQEAPLSGGKYSIPLLCEMKQSQCWVSLAQAASYGSYCMTWLEDEKGVLRERFPMNQVGPIVTTLPFTSPWRLVMVSPGDLSRIVEQTLCENLNPPTDPALKKAPWIITGAAGWDYLHSDRNAHEWTDFLSDMGWKYYVMDAHWQQVNPGEQLNKAISYASSKGIGLIVWDYAPKMKDPKVAEAVMKKYSDLGLKGMKIDFFNRLRERDDDVDYEDTQDSMQILDQFTKLALKYKLLMVFHGCQMPTGERRRWPHVLGYEAVKGEEHEPSAADDCTLPFTRNTVGPMDYTPVHSSNLKRKTYAFMTAQAIVFESGITIFGDSYKTFNASPVREFFKNLPSTWDETRFIDGHPASHATLARRKGSDWYVGSMTVEARKLSLPLKFLKPGITYQVDIVRTADTEDAPVMEKRKVTDRDTLEFALKLHDGIALHFKKTATP
jgi:alpha-glucosidase